MNTELGNRLKALREEKEMTASDIVKKLKRENYNYCVQSIYKWESGVATPRINVLLSLAKIYGCDISYLMEERNLTYKNLTTSEIFLLHQYRNNFLFRSIAVQIMRLNEFP